MLLRKFMRTLYSLRQMTIMPNSCITFDALMGCSTLESPFAYIWGQRLWRDVHNLTSEIPAALCTPPAQRAGPVHERAACWCSMLLQQAPQIAWLESHHRQSALGGRCKAAVLYTYLLPAGHYLAATWQPAQQVSAVIPEQQQDYCTATRVCKKPSLSILSRCGP